MPHDVYRYCTSNVCVAKAKAKIDDDETMEGQRQCQRGQQWNDCYIIFRVCVCLLKYRDKLSSSLSFVHVDVLSGLLVLSAVLLGNNVCM